MKSIPSARRARWLLLASALLSVSLPAQPAAESHEALPNLDRRVPRARPTAAGAVTLAGESADPRATAEATLRNRVHGLRIARDPLLGTAASIGSPQAFLTGPAGEESAAAAEALSALPASDPHRRVKAFVEEHRDIFGHRSDVLAAARVSRDYVTAHNGLRTTVWEQVVDDIRVFEATFQSHVTSRGELVHLSSRLLPDAAAARRTSAAGETPAASPAISARAAVALAGRDIGEQLAVTDVAALGAPDGPDFRQRFSARALTDAEARLVWLPMDAATLRLCWEVTCTGRTRGHMYRVIVDAGSGEVQVRHGLTEDIGPASYRVFTSDSPSPFSPGHAAPSSVQPPLVERQLVTLAALNSTASPNGWIDDGVMETRGNNVDAHTDTNGDNVADLPRPQATGPARVFDPPLDLTQEPATYRDAAVVNLFYWCNWMHDKLYELGFTEAAGNFQNNNFGRGGLGNDALQADAQDGSGTNNANFSTPSDGSPPRMQMFIWTGATPDRDGDFDQEVVLHEYTHGLSNRLVGGGVGLSASVSRAMGEGWSDFYGIALLSEATDDFDAPIARGGYSRYLAGGTFTENYYFGGRRYPFSTKLTQNPLTFKDIDPTQASTHSGVPRNPIVGTTADEVHNAGEVWAVTLWDARVNLIKKHGFATGNQLILQLVTDGMKLSPANPNFLEARDAILQADRVATSGANQRELWAAFARRGMGFNAVAPVSSTTVGLIENFDLPDDLEITPIAPVEIAGQVGGPFTPASAAFTLTNRGTASLGWSASKAAAWLNLSATGGTLAAGASATVTATLNSSANSLADSIYAALLTFTNTTNGVGQSRTVRLAIEPVSVALFTEDFESGTLDSSKWTVSGTGTFRTQVTTANAPHGGTRHLTMDSTTDLSSSRNEATLTLNLAGEHGVRLVFWAKGFGEEPSGPPASPFTSGADFDGVAISADGVNWYEVQPLRASASPPLLDTWSKYVVDLDPLLAARGLTFNSTFKIRFNQYDNYRIPTDGIAIDDLQVLRIVGAGAPTITTAPAGQNVNAGANVTFSVAATAIPAPSFQWNFNGVPIAGATQATLSLTNVQVAQAGSYSVTVTNGFGSVTSGSVLLFGTAPPPVLSVLPAPVMVPAGQPATLSVTASGTAPLAYQWRRGGVIIPGATNATYTIPAASLTDADLYEVQVSSGLSYALWSGARLSVVPPVYPQALAVGAIPRATFESSDTAYVYKVLPLADGRLYAAGDFVTLDNGARTHLARFNADGSLDPTFATPGLNGPVRTLAVQADGKVIIGGSFTKVGSLNRSFLARLNADGSPDATYATGGVSSTVYALAFQSDGKLLVGGAFSTYYDSGFAGTSRGRLARLNPDGTLDAAFNPAPNSTVYALAVQTDGRVSLGGAFTTVAGTTRNRVARMNSDGTLDATFAPSSGANSTVNALALQSDGKLVVGGAFTSFNSATANYLVRVDSTGATDTTFATGSGFNSTVNDLALQSNGSVIAGGSFTTYNGTTRTFLARVLGTGAVDTTFNPGPTSNVYSVAVASDGRVVFGGFFSAVGSTTRAKLARVSSTGAIDSGLAHTFRTGGNVYTAILLPGGKVLAGGFFTHVNGTALPGRHLVRFNPDGSVDSTFNAGAGPSSTVNMLLLRPDGRVIVGGSFSTFNNVSKPHLARLGPDGALDAAFFGADAAPNSSVLGLANAPDGGLFVGGSFTTIGGRTRNRLAKLRADGTLDPAFDPGAGASSTVYAFAPMADGKVYVGGGFSTLGGATRNGLGRLNADGTLDPAFVTPNTFASVYTLALRTDGMLFAGGSFGGSGYNYLARFTSSGALDSTFSTVSSALNGSVWSLNLQADGRLIVGGFFTTIGGAGDGEYLARFNGDGTRDTTFTISNLGGGLYAAVQRDNGQLFLAGSYAAGAMFTNAASGTAPVFTTQPAGQTVAAGAGVTFSAAASGNPAPAFQWYFNSAPISGATNASYSIAAATVAQAGAYTVTAANTAGSVTSTPAMLVVTQAPAIVTQPVSQTVLPGASVTFSVVATGNPVPTYQWRKGGTPLTGATASSYAIASVASADAGGYDVVVTNSVGSVTSSTATLTVSSGAPTITTPPLAQVATAGSAVTFGVIASGSGTLAYQWFKDGTALSGATNATLTFTNVQSANVGSYTVTVTNGVGSVTSPAATLTLLAAGAELVAVSNLGQPVLAYLAVGKSNSGPYDFSLVGSFTTGPVASAFVKVTLFVASKSSGATGLTVALYTGISTAGPSGLVATLSGETSPASGASYPYVPTAPTVLAPATTYWIVISAPTTPTNTTFGIRNTTSMTEDAGGVAGWSIGDFRYLTNNGGSTWFTSSTSVPQFSVTAVIGAVAPAITTQPIAQTVTAGSTATFSVVATGTPPPAYQWRKDGTDLTGATSASLTLTNVQATDAGAYTVVVANAAGSVTSNAASLTVTSAGPPRGLLNGSTRVALDSNASVLHGLFTVEGTTAKRMLVRAVGPALAAFGLTGAHPDPTLEVFHAGTGASVASNDNWSGAELSAAFAQVGAFALPAGSRDAALIASFTPGTYRVRVGGVGSATGVVLLEIYEADTVPRLVYLALRGRVGTGDAVLIKGLVIATPPAGRSYLIRALGPALGIAGALADPHLSLFNSSGASIATNDNWGGDATLASLAASVGAMPLVAASKDAALNFTPTAGGSFTVQVSGVASGTGLALLEVFEVDSSRSAALAPAVVSSPENVTVAAGQPATLGVVTIGKPAPTYQWRRNGVNLSGATGATLAIAAAQATDAGSYDVVATNATGTATSAAATLTVSAPSAPPTITSHPASQTISAGQRLTLNVGVSGTAPFAYQWKKGAVAVAGATNATFTIASVTADDAGAYSVAVTNTLGTATSNAATITVVSNAFAATHALVGAGYRPGGTVTITNTVTYTGGLSALGWSVQLPAGWSFASTSSGDSPPQPGDTGLLNWAWLTIPSSGHTFTYTLDVPAGVTGAQLLTATLQLRQNGTPYTFVATPDPLVVSQVTFHSADTMGATAGSAPDNKINLAELLRVIELYNYRAGTVRTGQYTMLGGTEDGFTPGPNGAALTLYHSADTMGSSVGTPRDGKINLAELLRVIELYNYRAGTVRTGQYHAQAGTEDGFAPGP
ncbi:MAG: M36 family metallopeptidase [Verrucomicrobia bacterium]|nr:M36 family metallopeptidase [Verrucomicrobiota bacterium]